MYRSTSEIKREGINQERVIIEKTALPRRPNSSRVRVLYDRTNGADCRRATGYLACRFGIHRYPRVEASQEQDGTRLYR